MPRVKLTKTVIDALPAPSKDTVHWDTGCPGFGLKITPKGRKIFVDIRLSPTIRRTVTMLPALALLAIGTSPTSALIASQVVLSFGIPFALYALLRVARDREVLGTEAIGRGMTLVLGGISTIVVCLNVIFLVDTIAG